MPFRYTTQPESNSYKDVYRYPEFVSAMNEYFDITDDETRRVLLSVNEADQSQVLVALTSKLYDNIVERVDDIDYGDIPATKGDITLLPNFTKLINCLDIIEKILIEFKQDTDSVIIIQRAIENIQSRKDLFEKAYKFNIELPIITYSTMTLAVISATSLLISSCIEFIKTPAEQTFNVTIDKVGLARSKQHMLFTNLKKFNNSCQKGEFDKAMNFITDSKIKKIGEAAISATVGSIIGGATVILLILPILRELIFLFYYIRVRTSEYFDIQADLLQMNAYNIEYNETMDTEKKKKIAGKQFKIADMFRKIANKLSITTKEAEVKATKDIVKEDKKKYKTNDIMDEMPDSASNSLF